MREALDPTSNTGLALPPDKLLLADLCAPRWELRGSKILVESRDDIVKRIGRITKYETKQYVGNARIIDLNAASAGDSQERPGGSDDRSR